ncbi:hypothetical protein D3C72_1276850 [compost metagenome]
MPDPLLVVEGGDGLGADLLASAGGHHDHPGVDAAGAQGAFDHVAAEVLLSHDAVGTPAIDTLGDSSCPGHGRGGGAGGVFQDDGAVAVFSRRHDPHIITAARWVNGDDDTAPTVGRRVLARAPRLVEAVTVPDGALNRRHVTAEPDPGGAQFVLEEVQLHQLAQSFWEVRVLVEVDLADDGALRLHRAAEEDVDGVGRQARVPDGPQLGNGGAQDGRDQHVQRRLLNLLGFLQDGQAGAFQ